MPPNRTIIIEYTGKGLEEYYDLAERTLQEYYDRSPTSLINIPETAEDRLEPYYRALAEQIAKDAPASGVPIGKRVV